MKKKLLSLGACLLLSLSVVSCNTPANSSSSLNNSHVMTYANGYFVIEDKWTENAVKFYIIHAKDTGVKYFMTITTNSRSMTPLYNIDGTLQIADGYNVED